MRVHVMSIPHMYGITTEYYIYYAHTNTIYVCVRTDQRRNAR